MPETQVKRRTRRAVDSVDFVAYILLATGCVLLVWGTILEPPTSVNDFVSRQFGDWTPGMIVDGLLLFIVNRIIHSNEKRRVISQVASLSNEFALDAVRRTRVEGWLQDGSLSGGDLARARLFGADLSDAELSDCDLSFADLRDTSLRHANLRGVNLVGANLGNADLRWSDLTGAQLMWADLRLAQFDGANVKDVDASFASIDEQAEDQRAFANTVKGGYLKPNQIELIRSSFDQVLTAGEPAISRFYEKLFESVPEARSMFPGSMNRQVRKFLQSLRLIVSSLDKPERAVLVLQQLGERHQGYGVKAEHYAPVGQVLIATLQELLGDSFTSETKEAWVAAYSLVSSVMSYAGEAPGRPGAQAAPA